MCRFHMATETKYLCQSAKEANKFSVHMQAKTQTYRKEWEPFPIVY